MFGFSDSFAKVTGSIGKGLSAATLDKAYQDRRRLNMARNKPKHAIYGVTQGATSLGDSIVSGVAGLVVSVGFYQLLLFAYGHLSTVKLKR